MAVLGGREKKKKDRKQRPLSGSFSHQKIRQTTGRRICNQTKGFLLCPRKAFPQLRDVEQKASPVVEDEEG